MNHQQVQEWLAQLEVWSEVEHHLDAFAAAAPTRDVVESYDAAGDRLDEYRRRIELPEGAVCHLSAFNSELASL